MLKTISNIILGLSEVVTIIAFSAAYSFACLFFAWIPELSFSAWALITGVLSLSVLGLSIGLWLFTSHKESIHGWILLPGIFVGKVWISSSQHHSFNSWLNGSIIVSLLFVLLVLSEAVRTWFSNKSPRIQGS
ncbi:MAG TPA: hypothetical protein VN456_09165 [Desulfosporosinus sp.]|nr:hypothetical protein [Desulfosporosinus sp.]